MTIPEIVQQMVDMAEPPNYAIVDSVDVSSKTCEVTVIEDQTKVFGVRLLADGQDGAFYQPALGSVVGIVFKEESEAFVCLYSKLDSIQFGDGSNGGLVQSDEVTARLNAIENDINDLKQIFTSWAPVSGDGGAALKTLLGSYSGSTLDLTNTNQLQNTDITHGDL